MRRSAEYPRLDLSSVLAFIEAVEKNFGNSKVSDVEVASAVNYANINVDNFKKRTSSSRQFGLITNVKHTISLTPAAIAFLHPKNEEERQLLLVKVIQAPKFYGKILSDYNGQSLPSIGVIKNILIRDYQITESASSIAASIFVKSVTYAGVLQNGVVNLEPHPQTEPSSTEETESTVSSEANTEAVSAPMSVPTPEDYYVQSISLIPGQAATLSIPKSYSNDQVDLTMNTLNALIKGIKQSTEENKDK